MEAEVPAAGCRKAARKLEAQDVFATLSTHVALALVVDVRLARLHLPMHSPPMKLAKEIEAHGSHRGRTLRLMQTRTATLSASEMTVPAAMSRAQCSPF